MTLWPKHDFDPEETLPSFADRLSIMHTGRGMPRLIRDLGINVDHFLSGREPAVACLAEATGHAPDDLQRNAIRVFQRSASFRGEVCSRMLLSPRAHRYCPECLANDGDPANRQVRLFWVFRHVARCDRHAVRLAETSNQEATNLRTAMADAPLAEPERLSDETPEYLVWLRGRLEDAPGYEDAWLAGQTLEQVLASSEMLGAVLEHGHGVALRNLPPPETEQATDIGFTIFREGPQAVEEALDTIRGGSPATAVQAGPLAHYGRLFDWLDRRSNALDPGPIRDVLRDHIVKHSAVEPGTMVLGVEVTERRYHSLGSLSEAVGIDRPRLSRLLRKLDEVPDEASEVEVGATVFEAARTIELIEAFNTAVPMREVPAYLGASKRQIEGLYRVGILQPLVPRTGRGSVRHVVFARSHLDDILGKLAALPEVNGSQTMSLLPVATACQRGAGPFDTVFRDILSGRLPAYRHPEKTGIRAVQVDLAEIVSLKPAG